MYTEKIKTLKFRYKKSGPDSSEKKAKKKNSLFILIKLKFFRKMFRKDPSLPLLHPFIIVNINKKRHNRHVELKRDIKRDK